MLEWIVVTCPYCGEAFETSVDPSAGSGQYVEDCQVCCGPILFTVSVDVGAERLAVETRRENE